MRSRERILATAVVAVVMLALGVAVGALISPGVKPQVITERITLTTPYTIRIVSVVDALGREVVFETPPVRVVSLAPSITEILFALGLGDRVVGVTSYCNYPPEVQRLVGEGRISVIGGFWNPDLEKILSLQPDLVIGSAGTRPHLQLKDKLEEAGIKVIYIYGSNAANHYEVFRDIRLVAEVFGARGRAEELISSIEAELDAIADALTKHGVELLKVLILLGPPSWGLYSAGGNTFIGWAIDTAGGKNIAGKFSGWPLLDYEYVLSEDPDVVIVSAMGADYKALIDEISSTSLANTKAFREGRVYIVDGEANDILMRPGPRIAKAVRLLASILYQEIFGESGIPTVYRMSLSTTTNKGATATHVDIWVGVAKPNTEELPYGIPAS